MQSHVQLHRGALAVTIFAMLLGLTIAKAQAGEVVRMQARLDGSILAIPARIGGRLVWMDLDTGATHTIVDSSFEKALRLNVLGERRCGVPERDRWRRRVCNVCTSISEQKRSSRETRSPSISHTAAARFASGVCSATTSSKDTSSRSITTI